MFLAHKNDIPSGWTIPLMQYHNHRSLTNQHGSYRTFSNICSHQRSIILREASNEIRCQYHGWSWDNDGNPTSSGSTKICNEAKLKSQPAYLSNGLLFTDDIDIAYLGIDFGNLKLIEHRIDQVQAQPTVIMDVFLDVDHIPIVHAGIYDKIGIEGEADVEWDYHSWGSVQKVRPTHDTGNEWAALWIAIYPGTMIEWQPGSLFITEILPIENHYTPVAVWKYMDLDSDSEQRHMNDHIWETAWNQDKHQSSSIVGSPGVAMLEESKLHFRKWASK